MPLEEAIVDEDTAGQASEAKANQRMFFWGLPAGTALSLP
jgi:hypothetical protein